MRQPEARGVRLHLWIEDTQATATGYTINTYGTQRGILGTVVDAIASRNVVISNPSNLGYSRL